MLKLLVIDDNQPICQALQTLFALQGYQVFCAHTPEQAWQILSQHNVSAHSIDLILQDMNFAQGEMSGAQGKELFYQLRSDYPSIPVVLLTAWTHLDMVVELVKAGATDYIAKPWDDQRLLATVNTLLELAESNAYARRVIDSWAAAEWFTAKPELPAEITVTVFKVEGETNTDDLSPATHATTRPAAEAFFSGTTTGASRRRNCHTIRHSLRSCGQAVPAPVRHARRASGGCNDRQGISPFTRRCGTGLLGHLCYG